MVEHRITMGRPPVDAFQHTFHYYQCNRCGAWICVEQVDPGPAAITIQCQVAKCPGAMVRQHEAQSRVEGLPPPTYEFFRPTNVIAYSKKEKAYLRRGALIFRTKWGVQ